MSPASKAGTAKRIWRRAVCRGYKEDRRPGRNNSRVQLPGLCQSRHACDSHMYYTNTYMPYVFIYTYIHTYRCRLKPRCRATSQKRPRAAGAVPPPPRHRKISFGAQIPRPGPGPENKRPRKRKMAPGPGARIPPQPPAKKKTPKRYRVPGSGRFVFFVVLRGRAWGPGPGAAFFGGCFPLCPGPRP